MITLPFPAKILWPNGRGHYMKKSRAFKAHREWARVATLASLPRGFKHNGGAITLAVTITPKTAHKIDADNAVASLKAYFDGIAAALKVDDSCFTVPVIEFANPLKPGGVEVRFIAPLSPLSPVDNSNPPWIVESGRVEQNEAEGCCYTPRPTPETLQGSATDAA